MDYIGKPTFFAFMTLAVLGGVFIELGFWKHNVKCEIREANLASRMVVCPDEKQAFELVPLDEMKSLEEKFAKCDTARVLCFGMHGPTPGYYSEKTRPAQDGVDAGTVSVQAR